MLTAQGWSVRSRDWRIVSLAVLALALIGCANRASVVADPDYRAARARSRVLVVPRAQDVGSAPAVHAAARLLTAELASRWFNVLSLDIVLQTSPDLGPPLFRMAHQALAGQPIDRGVVEVLMQRHGVAQLLVMDVFQYEQYWGRQTKVTRVGVEARLVQLAEGRTLWQGRCDPELSGAPGDGFDAATRGAVQELVRAMTNGSPEFKDTPFAAWPVLEYFAPN
jgi:hypothetical protein